MIINDKYEIRRDKHNFILVEHSRGTNPKTGAPTHSENNKYYPSMELVCLAALSASVKTDDMQTIIDTIKQAKFDILEAISKAKGANSK